MGIFERFRKQKEPNRLKKARKVIPVCSKCGIGIENLDVSIGDAIEQQGACLYAGSEGHLYEPIFDGVICTSCGLMLCDLCQSKLTDETRCPKCGGMLRQIMEHRLPKSD
jgi:bacterioferritin-associated ferredoxin